MTTEKQHMPMHWTDQEIRETRGSWVALLGLLVGFTALMAAFAALMFG